MKVCLLCVEIFAWGKYGGFGRATRTIGRELVKRGIEVYAVVPRRKGQNTVENLDGITVYGFPMYQPWKAWRLLRQADADIYHSCEPSFTTYLAMKVMPHRKHMITFRDPRNLRDWGKEFARPAISKLQVLSNFLFEHNFLVSVAVRRADKVYSLAKYLIPKIKSMYRLKEEPIFLPTPVALPGPVEKADKPTVGYLARWDRVKRPELFLELASKFPNVRFIAGGHSRDESWDTYLRNKFGNQPNLEMLGFVDQFNTKLHTKTLGRCWIMVNTSTKEALPNAFLEAAAHQCAILAGLDPDGFSSKFGFYAKHNNFADGIQYLLEKDRWKVRGLLGYQYIKDTFETERAINLHIEAYRSILN